MNEGRIVGFDVQGTVPRVCHVLAGRQGKSRMGNEGIINNRELIIYLYRIIMI